jgi:hypothetical protein
MLEKSKIIKNELKKNLNIFSYLNKWDILSNLAYHFLRFEFKFKVLFYYKEIFIILCLKE